MSTDRANIEAAVRAFPWWPFNRGPFVKLGVWYVSRALPEHESPSSPVDASLPVREHQKDAPDDSTVVPWRPESLTVLP